MHKPRQFAGLDWDFLNNAMTEGMVCREGSKDASDDDADQEKDSKTCAVILCKTGLNESSRDKAIV